MGIRPLSNDELHRLIGVSKRQYPASTWFKDVHFLNVYTGRIEQAQIALFKGRIAYVGDQEPLTDEETAIIQLREDQLLVPGYIEPHAHPFQLYTPLSWGEFLLTKGTTVSVNDNLFFYQALGTQQALQMIEELDRRGPHLWLWWARLDDQSHPGGTSPLMGDEDVMTWLSHPLVLQGGEVTSWPLLLSGDETLGRRMQLTTETYGKRLEGHLPGASLETLNALTAAGISADHEALNGDDVIKRLRLGLYATLRYSSIRPDLPLILNELREIPGVNLSRLMLTNDGSMPYFVEQSSCPEMVRMVMEAGFPAVEAYRMVTLNPAVYYGLDQEIGGIAPGRLAHINVLNALEDPQPVHVMVEGKWVVRDGWRTEQPSMEWLADYFPPLQKPFSLREEDLRHLEGDWGIRLSNEVITRTYTFDPDQPLSEDEAYISLVSRRGEWILNTRVKGFSGPTLLALVSTFTASGDFVLIGRNHTEMIAAFEHVFSMGGGILARFEGGGEVRIPLPLSGLMSPTSMPDLKQQNETFRQRLKEHGYPFDDPLYTLLFFTATHLPFVRLTGEGLYLIRDRRRLVPVSPL